YRSAGRGRGPAGRLEPPAQDPCDRIRRAGRIRLSRQGERRNIPALHRYSGGHGRLRRSRVPVSGRRGQGNLPDGEKPYGRRGRNLRRGPLAASPRLDQPAGLPPFPYPGEERRGQSNLQVNPSARRTQSQSFSRTGGGREKVRPQFRPDRISPYSRANPVPAGRGRTGERGYPRGKGEDR